MENPCEHNAEFSGSLSHKFGLSGIELNLLHAEEEY